ncbi:cupin domain-containing protein [Ferdinandcohnia sp. Marseille-Q9671]
MSETNAQYYISKLGLKPHPEGGFYKNTYASDVTIEVEQNRAKTRNLFTSIYFLLRFEDISHFHRLQSDELWYYHGGSSLTVHIIDENGEYTEAKLGLNLDQGEVPQVLVPKHSIFGSSVKEEDTFSLVGCMVSPGFDFEDFKLFTQDELLKEYPQYDAIIRKLAYKSN